MELRILSQLELSVPRDMFSSAHLAFVSSLLGLFKISWTHFYLTLWYCNCIISLCGFLGKSHGTIPKDWKGYADVLEDWSFWHLATVGPLFLSLHFGQDWVKTCGIVVLGALQVALRIHCPPDLLEKHPHIRTGIPVLTHYISVMVLIVCLHRVEGLSSALGTLFVVLAHVILSLPGIKMKRLKSLDLYFISLTMANACFLVA